MVRSLIRFLIRVGNDPAFTLPGLGGQAVELEKRAVFWYNEVITWRLCASKNKTKMQLKLEPKVESQIRTKGHRRIHIKHNHNLISASVAQPMPKIIVRKPKSKIKEGISFLATAAVIFLFTFFSLNYSAYSKQISFWAENLSASTITAGELEQPAETPNTVTTTDDTQLVVSNFKKPKVTIGGIPKLDLNVTPPDNRIIIPRLHINAPIKETAPGVDITDPWSQIEESVQAALLEGVVRLPNTARPGQVGNAFLTGHSSYYPWVKSLYKDIFALLPKIQIGDEIIVYYDQQRYVYIVSDLDEVSPKDVFVMGKTKDARLTLMTCVPIGTTLKRLVVTALLAPARK